MRMRGSLAGPERVVHLAPGLFLLLPDGTSEVDGDTLAAWLAGPSVPHLTGVRAGSAQVFWGLGLWLAAHELRSGRLNEERPSGPRGTSGGRLTGAPLRGPGWQSTLGLLDRGGLAILTSAVASARSGLLTLGAAGFGPDAARLAADLAVHVEAWSQAGRPGIASLHIDAYPRPGPTFSVDETPPPGDALMMERPGTRFAVYHD